jgi:hypothetical protein
MKYFPAVIDACLSSQRELVKFKGVCSQTPSSFRGDAQHRTADVQLHI